MASLAKQLFQEVSPDFFRVLASPLAGLYVDVLSALEEAASYSHEGLERHQALALIEAMIKDHQEFDTADSPFRDLGGAPMARAGAVLESLRRAGWLQEEERSDWLRLIHFDPNGTVVLQALRKIAFPEAVVFSDKLVNVCSTLGNSRALAEEPWSQVESCLSNLETGIAELRGMRKSIDRHTKKQLAASTLRENLSVLFDQFVEHIGRACYAELVRARLPSKLALARRNIDDLGDNLELLTKMQVEVMRRMPSSADAAMAHVRLRLNDLCELLDSIQPIADAIDKRTADFARRSQARFLYLQETTSQNRQRVQTFFEILNQYFAGRRLSELERFDMFFPAVLLHELRVPWGLESLYIPRVRRSADEIEPMDDLSLDQQDRTLAQFEVNVRDSLTVSRANAFVSALPGRRGTVWESSDLLADYVHNDEDIGHLIACLLHGRSADAEYEIRVPRLERGADEAEFDSKLGYRVERFVLVKK